MEFNENNNTHHLIKKQYGRAVIMDEVNKLIDKQLRNYIKDNEIDMLGGPIPIPQDNINWDSDKITFEFEVGLTPKFDIKLKFKKPITNYIVEADEKMINEQISSIQKQYGKLTTKKNIEKDCDITGVFTHEDEINNKSTFNLNRVKSKKTLKKLLGLKVGDSINIDVKDLFNDNHDLIQVLGISNDRAKDIDIEVNLNIDD